MISARMSSTPTGDVRPCLLDGPRQRWSADANDIDQRTGSDRAAQVRHAGFSQPPCACSASATDWLR
ncbi:hypothetical protein A7D01_10015 [Xanthomonas arboricola]|nr:hypothetical protein A7D01_10015 [Xanthomonas arboricola]